MRSAAPWSRRFDGMGSRCGRFDPSVGTRVGSGSLSRPVASGPSSPIVIVKRGIAGATVLARGSGTEAAGSVLRFEVATKPIEATDSTGAGDAFDAGFLVAWLGDRPDDDRVADAGAADDRPSDGAST